jgi:rhodanese-related sulfurtransferase
MTSRPRSSASPTSTSVLLDTLPASYYEQTHIPGALNLVEDDVRDLASTLIPDPSTPVVTYCSNAACGNSHAVATLLEKAGYTNVRTYRDGIQDWVEAGLPVATGAHA